jgi:hypothetical protein
LSRIFKQIDGLEKTPIEIVRYTNYNELVRPFIIAGLLALGLELALSGTRVIRVP